MVSFTSLAIFAISSLATVTATVLPNYNSELVRRDGTPDSNGTAPDGCWYIYRDDLLRNLGTPSNAGWGDTSGGGYVASWIAGSWFVFGKGWATGAARAITYTLTSWSPGTTGIDPVYGSVETSYTFAGVYGWTNSPIIEYFIVEDSQNGVSPNPPNPWKTGSAIHKGSFVSDLSTYDIYTKTLSGYTPYSSSPVVYHQFFSVRASSFVLGHDTITTANHFAAWAGYSMNLGTTWGYQIFATIVQRPTTGSVQSATGNDQIARVSCATS